MSNDDDKKSILPNLMTQVLMTQLDPTEITPSLRASLLARGEINVEERNKNYQVRGVGIPWLLVRGPSSQEWGVIQLLQ